MNSTTPMEHKKTAVDVLSAIHHRHAVRNFLPEKIAPETINQLLDAANYAPAALHEQSRAFVVIQDKLLLNRLSESAKELIASDNKNSKNLQWQHIVEVTQQKQFNVFYNAHTLVIIYSVFKGPFVSADCWLAAQNLMLAALPFGLGSCVIGFAVPALNLPEWKKELGIPGKMTAVAPIILGYPNEQTLATVHQKPVVLKWI